LQLLTPKQVCAQLAVSRKTLQRLTNDREIGFIKVGGQVRFRDTALAVFLTKNEELARPPKK
jgi:excisionase family DNA binding protein